MIIDTSFNTKINSRFFNTNSTVERRYIFLCLSYFAYSIVDNAEMHNTFKKALSLDGYFAE